MYSVIDEAAQARVPSQKKPLSIGTGEPTGDKTADAGTAAFHKTLQYIENKGGRFILDDYGEPMLILAGKQIPLTPDNKNIELNSVLYNATGFTMTGQIGKTAATLLQMHGKDKGDKIKSLPFSYLDQEAAAIYIPHTGNQILKITANETALEDNGADVLWLAPPSENDGFIKNPLEYTADSSTAALAQFERMIVETIPVEIDAMKWFLTMQEGFFPYVRHFADELMIVVHQGKPGCAKTFSATRFHQLHGMGTRPPGDKSVAWVRNGGCNRGFFVYDNKESANLTQEMIDLFLQISTGATSGRSSSDGKTLQTGMKDRPVTVVTTVEGLAIKEELEKRTVVVNFRFLPEEVQSKYDGKKAMLEIKEHRHSILSAFVPVFQQFLRDNDLANLKYSPSEIPKQALRFKNNYIALMHLLRAYGKITERPAEWAEGIIKEWCDALNDVEHFDSPLEVAIGKILQSTSQKCHEITWEGKQGKLYVFNPTDLFREVFNRSIPQEIRDQLPPTPSALSYRVRSLSGPHFYSLDAKNAPEHKKLVKRSSAIRALGIFVVDGIIATTDSWMGVNDLPECAA